MTIMLTALAALLVLALALPVGAGLGLIRDQGQPYYLTEEEKRRREAAGLLWSKWKEAGIVVMAITFGGLVAWRYGVDIQTAALWGVGVGAWTAMAWTQGHRKGLDLANPLDWVAMCGTGLAVSLGPAVAMVWHGDIVAGAVIAFSGALKAPAYWLGYRIRGRGDHPWPHATAIGAVAHGAVAYAATVAVLVLA